MADLNWVELGITILTLLGGDAILRLIFFKATKKKATAEAVGVEKDNEGKAVETLHGVIEELNIQLQRKDELLMQYFKEREEYRLDREEKAEENASIKQSMCVHWACVLRHPGIGRGDVWYQGHKEDPALGGDYLPINQLMRHYGLEKKKREQTEKEIHNGTENCQD